MFDGEILALSGPSSVTSVGDLLRLFADVLLSAASFSIDAGI